MSSPNQQLELMPPAANDTSLPTVQNSTSVISAASELNHILAPTDVNTTLDGPVVPAPRTSLTVHSLGTTMSHTFTNSSAITTVSSRFGLQPDNSVSGSSTGTGTGTNLLEDGDLAFLWVSATASELYAKFDAAVADMIANDPLESRFRMCNWSRSTKAAVGSPNPIRLRSQMTVAWENGTVIGPEDRRLVFWEQGQQRWDESLVQRLKEQLYSAGFTLNLTPQLLSTSRNPEMLALANLILDALGFHWLACSYVLAGFDELEFASNMKSLADEAQKAMGALFMVDKLRREVT